jgi:hypothetical protein
MHQTAMIHTSATDSLGFGSWFCQPRQASVDFSTQNLHQSTFFSGSFDALSSDRHAMTRVQQQQQQQQQYSSQDTHIFPMGHASQWPDQMLASSREPGLSNVMNLSGSLGFFPAAAAGAQLPYLPYTFVSGQRSNQQNFGFENCEVGDPTSQRINLAVPPFFQPSVRTRPPLWEGRDSDPNCTSTAGLISPQFRLGGVQNTFEQSTFESTLGRTLDSFLSTSRAFPGWLDSAATPAVQASLSNPSLSLPATVRIGNNPSSGLPGQAFSMPLCAASSMQPDSAVHPAGIIPSQLGTLSNTTDEDTAALVPAPDTRTANEIVEEPDHGHRMAVDTLIN